MPKFCSLCGEKLGFRNEFVHDGKLVCKSCLNKQDKLVQNDESDDTIDKLVAWILNQKESGISAADIKDKLVNEGFDSESVNTFVDKVYSYESSQGKLSKIPTWIFILAGYIILNIVLYKGQEIYFQDDVEKCEQMESDIMALITNIEEIETTYKEKENRVSDLESQILGLQPNMENPNVSFQNISNYKNRYLDEIKEIRRKYLWNLGEQASYHKRWRIAMRERMLRKIIDKGEIEYFNVADRILNSIRAESEALILPPDDRELGLF